jgi:hypothetical protein
VTSNYISNGVKHFQQPTQAHLFNLFALDLFAFIAFRRLLRAFKGFH